MTKEEFALYKDNILKNINYAQGLFDNDVSEFSDQEKQGLKYVRNNLVNAFITIKDFLMDKDMIEKQIDDDAFTPFRNQLLQNLCDSSFDDESRTKTLATVKNILKNVRIHEKETTVKNNTTGKIEKGKIKIPYVYKHYQTNQDANLQKSVAVQEIKRFFIGWNDEEEYIDVIEDYYINKLGNGVFSIDLAPLATVLADYASGKISDKQFQVIDSAIAEKISNFKASARANYRKSKAEKD